MNNCVSTNFYVFSYFGRVADSVIAIESHIEFFGLIVNRVKQG